MGISVKSSAYHGKWRKSPEKLAGTARQCDIPDRRRRLFFLLLVYHPNQNPSEKVRKVQVSGFCSLRLGTTPDLAVLVMCLSRGVFGQKECVCAGNDVFLYGVGVLPLLKRKSQNGPITGVKPWNSFFSFARFQTAAAQRLSSAGPHSIPVRCPRGGWYRAGCRFAPFHPSSAP